MKATITRRESIQSERTSRRIALIGPYPPPYGGISVHIKRVLQHLEHENIAVDFFCETRGATIRENHTVYDFVGVRKITGLWQMLRGEYDLIHQHSPSPRLRIALAILGWLGRTVYLHVHGASLRDTTASASISGWLTRKLIKHCHVLADNSEIAILARKLGARSVTEIDAFLPPTFAEQTLHDFEEEYGAFFDESDFTISMTGWFEEYKGEDLYGFDTVLQALLKLNAESAQSIKLIASVNGVKSKALERQAMNFIDEHHLNDRVEFIRIPLEEIWPLYLKSDAFIRPSRSDGSALSILEADWFGTPVIASDCVPRPRQVMTFETGDADQLTEALSKLFSANRPTLAEKIERVRTRRFDYPLFSRIYGIKPEKQ